MIGMRRWVVELERLDVCCVPWAGQHHSRHVEQRLALVRQGNISAIYSPSSHSDAPQLQNQAGALSLSLPHFHRSCTKGSNSGHGPRQAATVLAHLENTNGKTNYTLIIV